MQTITDIATDIVAREGGYVDDPDDPGGATNYGVTIHTMRRLGLDLTNDGQVNEDDVSSLPQDVSVELNEMGVIICHSVEDLLRELIRMAQGAQYD